MSQKPTDKERALFWKCMYIAELMPIGDKEWKKEQAWAEKTKQKLWEKYAHISLNPTDYPKEFK
jgi:hypothetical protein